jgi:hypothetical protein
MRVFAGISDLCVVGVRGVSEAGELDAAITECGRGRSEKGSSGSEAGVKRQAR